MIEFREKEETSRCILTPILEVEKDRIHLGIEDINGDVYNILTLNINLSNKVELFLHTEIPSWLGFEVISDGAINNRIKISGIDK